MRGVKLFTLYFLIFTLLGCDAFVRKFTRKPKKESLPAQELVLAPEEYIAPQASREELYRQYFLYWKSWQDELINHLSREGSHKKQLDCAKEAVKNLVLLRELLNEEKQKKLDPSVNELNKLKDSISGDLYNINYSTNASAAERIKRNILRDFSYDKIKDHLR